MKPVRHQGYDERGHPRQDEAKSPFDKAYEEPLHSCEPEALRQEVGVGQLFGRVIAE